MQALKFLEWARRKDTFCVQDATRILESSESYAKLFLHRLVKRGLVKRVTKNVYTVKHDVWVVASNIVAPCYISFWSAAHYYGFTEQILNTIFVAVPFSKREVEFEGYKIKFVELEEFFGYKKERTGAGSVFIAEQEKLLIDAFLKPNYCGNFDEIIKVYENAKISEEKIVEYLKRVKKQAVVKRVGYLLEKVRGIDISKHFGLDRNYVILNPFEKGWSKVESKWRVKL
ncbi:MAG: hypothetical protein J7J87_01260 [Candidatus Diapherotrites archaeon]|nr:hypothetical protein [Candidatus Diapherotrites archaeon]